MTYRGRTLAVALAGFLFAGCMTVQHPNTGDFQYASMGACQQANLDTPLDCQKTVHKEGTKTAIGVGATILVVLGYLALVGLIIAGGR